MTLQIRADLKERPRMRAYIERRGWHPHILITSDGRWIWDGVTARQPDGTRTRLDGALSKQLRKMAAEGRWGELEGHVTVDPVSIGSCAPGLKRYGHFTDAVLVQIRAAGF